MTACRQQKTSDYYSENYPTAMYIGYTLTFILKHFKALCCVSPGGYTPASYSSDTVW